MSGFSRRGLMVGGTLALIAGPAAAQSVAGFAVNRAGTGTADHARFDALLARRARNSRDGVVRVDYAGWRASVADRTALKAYIASLSRLNPLGLTRPEQFAFWANLYNAVTVDVVLDAWPVRSIREIRSGLIPGPWKRKVATVAGVELSLDDMEHNILRKGWTEPRVHYAVNCASYSCPNLPLRAFRGATLGPAGRGRASLRQPPQRRSLRRRRADRVVDLQMVRGGLRRLRRPRHRPSGAACRGAAEGPAAIRDPYR